MSRPTMDRVIEAIDLGDLGKAKVLCSAMKQEWRFLHDLMVESVLGLVDFVKRRLGEDAVADAWRESMERGWRRDTAVIAGGTTDEAHPWSFNPRARPSTAPTAGS